MIINIFIHISKSVWTFAESRKGAENGKGNTYKWEGKGKDLNYSSFQNSQISFESGAGGGNL